MIGIYKIQSISNPDRVYIGSSVNIEARKIHHFNELRRKTHRNSKLQNHYNKYNEDDLKFEILIECKKEQLIRKEQCYINIFQPYFNICKIAGSGAFGHTCSLEAREKMRKKKLGLIPTQKTKDLLLFYASQKHSEERCKKQSIARTGSGNPMFGKKQSEETKRKRLESRMKTLALKKQKS